VHNRLCGGAVENNPRTGATAMKIVRPPFSKVVIVAAAAAAAAAAVPQNTNNDATATTTVATTTTHYFCSKCGKYLPGKAFYRSALAKKARRCKRHWVKASYRTRMASPVGLMLLSLRAVSVGRFDFRCTKKLHEQDCSAGGGRRPEADGEWLKGVWGRVGLPRAGRREAKILIF